MITGKVIGGEALEKRFIQAVPKVTAGVQKAVMDLALSVTRKTMTKLTGDVLQVRSGTLRRSIHPEYDFTADKAVAIIGTNTIYARIHEYGGVILPKTKKALKFKIGDKWVITKRVVMPERSFLRTALRETVPEIEAVLKAAVANSLKES